jgi:DNA-binding NtrC family response regulator
MRAEQTETIEPVRSGLQRNSPTAEVPLKLRIAERPERDRVQRLLDLAYRMLGEAETLARDKAFTDVSHRLEAIDPAAGVDFYSEVERFETGLIKLALDHTGGNQAKAARLLHIKPTTLYSKIKLYGIEY